MRVRLKTRWGSRLQGDIISVSVERAKVLAESGIAAMLDPLPPAPSDTMGLAGFRGPEPTAKADAEAREGPDAEAKAKAKGK